MKKTYHGTYAYKTDKGYVRENNEDQAMVLMNSSGEVFLIACDGMGGAKKGEVASKMAIAYFANAFRNKGRHLFKFGDKLWLTKVAKGANAEINKLSSKNKDVKGMGTTLVAALISGDRLFIANIGDSRAYRYSFEKNKIEQLTEDQTYVRYLVSAGKISEEEALSHPDRHVLMNALGIYPSVSLSIDCYPYRGESLLLCTDGLYNQVSKEQLANILKTDDRCDQKVASLVSLANHSGGTDNIGIALWEVLSND